MQCECGLWYSVLLLHSVFSVTLRVGYFITTALNGIPASSSPLRGSPGSPAAAVRGRRVAGPPVVAVARWRRLSHGEAARLLRQLGHVGVLLDAHVAPAYVGTANTYAKYQNMTEYPN